MSLSWQRIFWRCNNLIERIMRDLLSDIRRENIPDVAGKLMNHYCVLKKDSRYDSDLIFRFAEIEFYLYSYTRSRSAKVKKLYNPKYKI